MIMKKKWVRNYTENNIKSTLENEEQISMWPRQDRLEGNGMYGLEIFSGILRARAGITWHVRTLEVKSNSQVRCRLKLHYFFPP